MHLSFLNQCLAPVRPAGGIGVSQSEALGHCGKIVAKHGPIPIYFAVVDSGPTIEYEAELVDVHLDPAPSDPKTQGLLKHSGETTKPEGLWKETAETLYLVRGCRKLGEGEGEAFLGTDFNYPDLGFQQLDYRANAA